MGAGAAMVFPEYSLSPEAQYPIAVEECYTAARWVITGEADVLRDEGEAYAAKLRAAGVAVTAVRYEGIIHDFVMLNALRGTYTAQGAITQAIGVLGGALRAT